MSHPGQQPSDYYLVGSTNGYPNFGDERRPKRRSRNTTDNRHGPNVGQHTYAHQQPPLQYWCAPQTTGFGPTSLDFGPANGSNQAYPSFDAWSNVPPQDRYQNPTGNTFQLPDNGNSLHPISIPEYGHNWTDEQLLQPPFDWHAPVVHVGQAQSGYPYDSGRSAANETDWFTPGRAAQPHIMNQVPFQPTESTYGIDLARVPGQNFYYQPMSYSPVPTFNSNNPAQESARYSQNPQGAVETDDVGSSEHPDSLAMSGAFALHNEAPRSVSKQSPPPRFLLARTVATGPRVDGELKLGDNPPPRKPNVRTVRTVNPPRHPLSLSQITNYSSVSMKFLEPRPDRGDVSKIPFGDLSTGLFVMGIFDQKLSMSYVHPKSTQSLDPVTQLEFCDKNEEAMDVWLSNNRNEIISLFQSARRWTADLPRSTREKSNGIVTLCHGEEFSAYADVNVEVASLCVAAAALSSYSKPPFRPVFDRTTYDKVRNGEQVISAQPSRCLPSGVKKSSRAEMSRLRQVPPGWGNRKLPPLRIAGHWV